MHAIWIITLIFGAVASSIAYSRGRNSMAWFAAGLFLGPFALVVAFLEPIAREGMFAPCPVCREIVRADARMCRHCHTALEVARG